MSMKRRDLLEGSQLLIKHKIVKPGELDQTALMLAVSYLGAKRDHEADESATEAFPAFPAWLDEDVAGDELDDGDGDDEDPQTAS